MEEDQRLVARGPEDVFLDTPKKRSHHIDNVKRKRQRAEATLEQPLAEGRLAEGWISEALIPSSAKLTGHQ